MFYCSVLQEAIRFNIVPPLVAHDLTKNLEEFNWDSFKVWLDSISTNLIACQDKESCDGAHPGDEKIESSKSSSFPLPYPRGIPVKDPTKPSPKEKRRAYPTDNQRHFPYEKSCVAIACKQIILKLKAEDATSEESNFLRSQRRRLPPKEKEAPYDSGDKYRAFP